MLFFTRVRLSISSDSSCFNIKIVLITDVNKGREYAAYYFTQHSELISKQSGLIATELHLQELKEIDALSAQVELLLAPHRNTLFQCYVHYSFE